jgi:hypothetical protein
MRMTVMVVMVMRVIVARAGLGTVIARMSVGRHKQMLYYNISPVQQGLPGARFCFNYQNQDRWRIRSNPASNPKIETAPEAAM